MMQTNTLGKFGPVSRLTLGGGGIGQLWGEASDSDSVGTLHLAVDAGIDLIDTAPGYKNCKRMVGKAFEGKLPAGVRITTKLGLGTPPANEVYVRLRASLESSLTTMRLSRVDMMVLHTEIRPDDFIYPNDEPPRDVRSTSLTLYREAVVPAFERLEAEGLIGSWGITGINHAAATIEAMSSSGIRPVAVQAIANLLDSPGEMNSTGLVPRSRSVIAAAKAQGVGVMGVRAVQAGALTAALDRPDQSPTKADFDRAQSYRDLCREWGADPAIIGFDDIGGRAELPRHRPSATGCSATPIARSCEPCLGPTGAHDGSGHANPCRPPGGERSSNDAAYSRIFVCRCRASRHSFVFLSDRKG
jgi:aryl-alcohol dehydrogenase-like predicted oxidoreductase